MIRNINSALILFVFMIFTNVIFTQNDYTTVNDFGKQRQTDGVQLVFSNIEKDFNSSDISSLSKYFGSQTYFSLENGVNGYYSSNQAYYVLESFFKDYRVVSFKLNKIRTDPDNPSATGVYNYDLNGKRDSVQVYLSIKKVGESWKITQISID